MVSPRCYANRPVCFDKPGWLFFRATGFHVNAHPLGVPQHDCGLVACANKLVLASHVGLAFVVADPGGNPQRVACKSWTLVFHVVLPRHAAISQFHEILKGQPKLT